VLLLLGAAWRVLPRVLVLLVRLPACGAIPAGPVLLLVVVLVLRCCCCRGAALARWLHWGTRGELGVVELAGVCKGAPAVAQVEGALGLCGPQRQALGVGVDCWAVVWVQELAAVTLRSV
jgi:hypothetical protein